MGALPSQGAPEAVESPARSPAIPQALRGVRWADGGQVPSKVGAPRGSPGLSPQRLNLETGHLGTTLEQEDRPALNKERVRV